MRKTFLLLTVVSFLFYACGEAGVESDISKIAEIDFSVSSADINGVVGSTISQSVDFADSEFEDYLADVEKFTLEKLEFEISGLTGAPATTLDLEIRIDLSNNTANMTDGRALLSIANVPVANTTSPVLLYNTDSSDPGIANASVVAALEQAILNKSTIEIELTSSKSGADLSENFNIKFLFDLTARVNLD